jgi:hypothetical protein
LHQFMNSGITKFFVISMAVFGFAGCITHEETQYRDIERAKVEFENDAAARIFYEAMSKAPVTKSGTEIRNEIEIPVIFKHRQRVESGPNFAFNHAVELCDTNKDAKITEAEAKIYAEMVQKK